MGDIETLFVLLGAVYLLECCVLADKQAFVFSPAPFRQQPRRGLALTLRSVLIFLNPIPLFATVTICQPAPISLSTQGVVFYNSLLHDLAHLRPAGQNFIAYTDITHLASKGANLLINDREFTCAHEGQALLLAEHIRKLAALRRSPLYTGAALEKAMDNALRDLLAPGLDAAAARQRHREVFLRTLLPASLATLLCTHLFAVMPVGLILSTSHPVWLTLALIFLALHSLIVIAFWHSLRKLYPHDPEGRFKKIAAALLNPFASMGCPSRLTREGLSAFHPLAIACALPHGRGKRLILHRLWAKLTYNTFPLYNDPLAHAQLTTHNRLLLSIAAPHLAEAGTSADQVLLAPAFDPTAHSYCPICLLQYTTPAAAECPYCLGVPLCTMKK